MTHAQYLIDICERDPMTSLPIDINPMPNGSKMPGAGVAVREPAGRGRHDPLQFPFFLNTGKVFPALAAGSLSCSRLSLYTPFEALVLAEAAEEAGLPKGVLDVVTGGMDVGHTLTTGPRIDLITFTGSDTVGAAIQAQSAPTLKRCLLELGGESALIVRPDGDLNAAAFAAVLSISQHAGQSCAADLFVFWFTTRSEKVFTQACVDNLSAIKVGDPADRTVRAPARSGWSARTGRKLCRDRPIRGRAAAPWRQAARAFERRLFLRTDPVRQ